MSYCIPDLPCSTSLLTGGHWLPPETLTRSQMGQLRSLPLTVWSKMICLVLRQVITERAYLTFYQILFCLWTVQCCHCDSAASTSHSPQHLLISTHNFRSSHNYIQKPIFISSLKPPAFQYWPQHPSTQILTVLCLSVQVKIISVWPCWLHLQSNVHRLSCCCLYLWPLVTPEHKDGSNQESFHHSFSRVGSESPC